ncbi:MAG: acyl-CoA carboxylase subunit beta [Burkholderiaceae bacterium]|jgi:acetyl-CoA carboxylase carboxyltransferase component
MNTVNDLNQDEWGPELEELHIRRQQAAAMGGQEALEKHRAKNRMNVRERIDALLDPGSFRELGRVTGKGKYDQHGFFQHLHPVNAVIGKGKIGHRKIIISADDFTLRAGSSESTLSEKWVYAERLALDLKLPLIRLVDTAGGSVKLMEQQGGSKIPGYPDWPVVPLMSQVPVVGVALGSCAGLGAIKVLMSHFSVMVKEQAQVFAAGPPVVKQAYGVDIDKNELGGYKVHRRSALVHNEADSEEDAFRQVRRFLSYLPSNTSLLSERKSNQDPPERSDPWLRNAIPKDRRKIFDPRKIMGSVFDIDSIFEIGKHQGGSIITALARLNGYPVGVLCNNPKVSGGAMTLTASWKIERHVKLCQTFNLPIVNLVDQPGNATGLNAELSGTLLGALRVLTTIETSTIPWVSIILRRAFGMAGGLHAPKYFPKLNYRFAWPSARWGSIPIEGGVAAAHRADIREAENPAEEQARLEAYYHRLASPFRTAEKLGVVDIIDPAETRELLCDWAEDAWAKITAEFTHVKA